METWYAFALADGTPLLAWDPEIAIEDGKLRLALTLDEDSARSADTVWQTLKIPEAVEGDISVRVVLDAVPEDLAGCADALSAADNPIAALIKSSFVDGDSLATLHRVGSFVPAEWRVDELNF